MAAVVTRPQSLAKRRETKFDLDLRKFKDGQDGSEIIQVYSATNIVDNTAFTFFTIVVPNATLGCNFGVTLSTWCGDGDAAQANYFTISLTRIAGAATAVVVGTASNVTSAGATASTITLAAGSTVGANTAIQTIPIQLTVARSGGSTLTHKASLELQTFAMASATQSNTLQGTGVYIQ